MRVKKSWLDKRCSGVGDFKSVGPIKVVDKDVVAGHICPATTMSTNPFTS